jgi:hypothetical protein
VGLWRAAGAGLALWLGTACASSGSELRELVLPDQFHVSYGTGRGDIDSKLDSTRGFNEEDSVVVVGMSWNLSRSRPSAEAVSRADLRQLFLALREDLRPAPAVEPEPEPEPTPAPAPIEPEPEPVAEVVPEPPPPEPVLLMIEPEVAPVLEPPPAPEPVLENAQIQSFAPPRVHVPEDLWPWLPIAALGLGLMLAFAVYSSPGGRRVVRDGRALASRAR